MSQVTSRLALRMSRRAHKSPGCPQNLLESYMLNGKTKHQRLVGLCIRTGVASFVMLNYLFCRLPADILIKVLSYLDASALLTVGHVSKRLHQFASDNSLWYQRYTAEFGETKKLKLEYREVPDQVGGAWKLRYFRDVASRDLDGWKRRLRRISRHTGLPGDTELVLRKLQVTWELTVYHSNGKETRHKLSWARFCGTSLTVCWGGGGRLPVLQWISSLRLHGVRRIALRCPGLLPPSSRSLMAEVNLSKSPQLIGEDRLVELHLLQPGIAIGLWKDKHAVAFITFTLHFHKLVERSVQGSSLCPYIEPPLKPPFDDIDPEYGLHGYQLHFVLHDTVCELMSGSYSNLFCSKAQVCDNLVELTAISGASLGQRTALSGNIALPWRCEALQGTVQNCCVMSLTLLDEFRKPFWCASSPVAMVPGPMPVCYDYAGDHFFAQYEDSGGKVKMQLVWMEGQFSLVSLVIFVPVGKVNRHFGRDY